MWVRRTIVRCDASNKTHKILGFLMHIDGLNDDDIRRVLLETRRIAVVGASANEARPSYGVAHWLVAHGYAVTPVNPGLAGQSLHGSNAVGELDQAAPLDMVDVFRASEQVPPVVEDAIRLGAKTVWMQLGVVHEAAAARARKAGLVVVMDRCPKIEAARLGVAGPA
jgi:predicted CoA-binding protein